MRSVVQWLLRRGALYILLVLAVAFGPLLAQAIFSDGLRDELMSPREVSQEFQRLKDSAVDDFKRRKAEVGAYPASRLKTRLAEARLELAAVTSQLQRSRGWFASIRPRTILKRKELELRQTVLQGEIRLLETASDSHALRAELRSVMAPTAGAIVVSKARCDRANEDVRRFNDRHALERSARNIFAHEARRLTDQARKLCAEYRVRVDAQRAAREQVQALQARLVAAQKAYGSAGVYAEEAISRIGLDLSRTVRSVLIKAAVLLAVMVATPYLIRLLFYFVLAPLAERRPSVRLRWSADPMSAPVTLTQASATSAPVTLRAGEELLVRQGFLQSTSSAGSKATRALLDWRHPLSSVASGLVFLTRIEGDGETTTVSAVRDPFAEVAVLDLAAGAACVLQPRALVAVVHRARQPVRITSHWRLGSLHAWLTFQLRFLMFHGPARLVIKGGRGIRVEQVERGRVLGQDQLVGFSANLAYSVTRTETFWPYFLGLEQLLKDKVEAGEGVLILEEAPMSAGGGAGPRKGLEGAGDALLKAVGI